MQILRVSDNVSLAFGLTWEGVDVYDSKLPVQIRKWRERGFTVACKYDRDGDMVYGLDADRVKRDKTRLVSGAALLATHEALAGKTGLVIIEVMQGVGPSAEAAAIVVGLRLGVVVLDRLASLEEVKTLRDQFKAELPTNMPWETWGQVNNIASVENDFSFKELTSGSRKRYSSCEIGVLRSTRPLVVGSIVATFAVASIAGWFVWDNMESEAQALKRAQEMALNSPTAQYKHNIDILMQTPVIPLGTALQTVRQQFAKFPVLFTGWQLESVSCMAKSCDVSWVRQHGTFAEFEAAAQAEHPEWTGLSLTSIDKLRHSVAIELPQSKLPAIASWPKSRIYRNETFSAWQFLAPGGWRATINAVIQEAMPVGLKPEQERELYSYAGAPYSMGMEIMKQAWWYVADEPVSPVQSLGDTAVLNGDVKLEYDGKAISFSAKGKVFVQN